MCEWIPIQVQLRQECVMSPWLFKIYMDGVVREEYRQVCRRSNLIVKS